LEVHAEVWDKLPHNVKRSESKGTAGGEARDMQGFGNRAAPSQDAVPGPYVWKPEAHPDKVVLSTTGETASESIKKVVMKENLTIAMVLGDNLMQPWVKNMKPYGPNPTIGASGRHALFNAHAFVHLFGTMTL
jgi:hypothetical protein